MLIPAEENGQILGRENVQKNGSVKVDKKSRHHCKECGRKLYDNKLKRVQK